MMSNSGMMMAGFGLHVVLTLLAVAGFAMLVGWAIKYLGKEQLKTWGLVFLLAGVLGSLVFGAAAGKGGFMKMKGGMYERPMMDDGEMMLDTEIDAMMR